MKTILILYLLMILFYQNLYTQDKLTSYLQDLNSQPVDMTVDVIHIKLNLDIEPFKQIVKGQQSITFRTLRLNTDSLIFHSPEMDFNEVFIDGRKSEFKKNGNEIVVYNKSDLKYNQIYEMTINFTGNPTTGLHFSGWNDKTNRHRKQIWAHSPQGWMPFINQKQDLLTTEIITTFDSKYKVFSNGDRISEKDNGNGTKTWHYKMNKPHVIYLVCIAIGDYDFKETQSHSGVPMELWYYPDLPENFDVSYRYAEYMIDFFEKEIGVKYPWSVYRQAPMVNYMYGAMETTTATVFGDFMYIPERAWWMRNYVNVNAHELNHQWFGNLVSHLNNRHTWLTESFATHYAKMFERDVYGEDYYQWERDKELIRTFNAAKTNNNPVGHSSAGTDRWYPKGSLVLDMMRDVMGNELYRQAIKYYTEKNTHQVTETYDLLKAIRESTGIAMDWFFEQWIWRGGEPHFKVSYTKIQDNASNRQTVVEIEQIHPTDNLISYFRVPAGIHVYYMDGSIDSVRKWIDGQKTLIRIPNLQNKEVDFVVFDPNRKIIKKITFERNLNELLSQAEKSVNMIDRYDALLALKKFSVDEKREIYRRIFQNEKFHLNKSEIISQLAGDTNSIEIIKSAIYDKDALVRRSVVENVKTVPEMLKSDYEQLLKDSCFLNLELALRNLSHSFLNEDYLQQTKNEIGWRGKNIRIAWLEIALGKSLNQNYLDELIDYSSLSFEFETRINALTAFKKLNIINHQTVVNAIDAYLHWNYKLRDGAYTYLKYVNEQNVGKLEIDKAINNMNFSDKQKSVINNLKAKLKE
ncbi:MAG: M1 family metallopeptidase [Candidatus Kapabacteria bacterium]|nr:M1 family metallopeptidase [Candidatus Kapabacteria bacterium]